MTWLHLFAAVLAGIVIGFIAALWIVHLANTITEKVRRDLEQ